MSYRNWSRNRVSYEVIPAALVGVKILCGTIRTVGAGCGRLNPIGTQVRKHSVQSVLAK